MTSRRYYGGPKATSKEIRVLSATDFKSLVSNYFNVPVNIPCTLAEYQAKSKAEQFELKNGPYICAARFVEGTTARSNEAAERMNLITLDLDTPEGENGDYLRDILLAPETVLESLHPFNCLIHTTASSTPERPRLRIVVDADIDPEHLRRGVRTVARMAGIPLTFKGITESSTVSQPAFRPVMFEGQPASPVLGSRTSGRTLTTDDLDEDTGEDHPQRTYAWVGDSDIASSLDQLPIPDITVDDLKDVFDHLDPDMGYREWVQVAASLRHQFRTEDAAREAFAAFDDWSARGGKYKGHEETYAKWQSFKPEAMGRRSVTVRHLFHVAQQAGWKNTRVAARTQQTFDEWLAGETNVSGLVEEACQRIAATPFRSEITEALMIEQVRKRVKELKGPAIPKETFVKQIKAVIQKMKKDDENAPAPGRVDSMPAWLRPFCYCGPENRFIQIGVPDSIGSFSPDAFNMNFSREMIVDPDAPPNTARVRPSTFAMDVCQIQRVHGCTYDPRHGGDEPFFKDGDAMYYNLYSKATLPIEDPKNSAKAGALFMSHLRALVLEEEYVEILRDFCAFIVQKPGIKIRWVPVIQSAQGAGKGILGSLMGAALGEANVGVVEGSTIFAGPWNDWAFGRQFIILNEIIIAGHSRLEMMNRLKSFITDSYIPKTEKYRNTMKAPNVANAIVFTNFHHALALEKTDRRHFVLKSAIQSEAQVEALVKSGHYERLVRLAEKFGGALRHWLLNVPIPENSPVYGAAPRTIYFDQMRDLGKSKAHVAVEAAVEDRAVIALEPLEERMEPHTRNSHPVSHHLYNLGFEPWNKGEKVDVSDAKLTLWVHRERFDSELDCAVTMAEHDLKKSGELF